MIYEKALEEGRWYDDVHLCKTCEYGMPLIEKDYLTTGDYHACDYAYKPGFVRQDNGGGFWVTGCAYYKKAAIDYYQYLRTKTWREKANERLKRDGYQCVLCGSAKNLSVHHITYENIGFEKMDDLISVCKGCHEKLHEHDSIRASASGVADKREGVAHD